MPSAAALRVQRYAECSRNGWRRSAKFRVPDPRICAVNMATSSRLFEYFRNSSHLLRRGILHVDVSRWSMPSVFMQIRPVKSARG